MKKLIQLAAITGLLVVAVAPAHAWWKNGNNWNQWDRYSGNYRNYDYGGNRGYRDNEWMYGPWSGDDWDSWRAPWSTDDSRWGSGPWDMFGDSMNDFIADMEGDVDLNMKIKAQQEGVQRSYGNSSAVGQRDIYEALNGKTPRIRAGKQITLWLGFWTDHSASGFDPQSCSIL